MKFVPFDLVLDWPDGVVVTAPATESDGVVTVPGSEFEDGSIDASAMPATEGCIAVQVALKAERKSRGNNGKGRKS